MKSIYFFIISICLPYYLFGFVTDYPSEYCEYSNKKQKPFAVAIVAFNRPQYLKQLIDSLEKNPESETLPFFFS